MINLKDIPTYYKNNLPKGDYKSYRKTTLTKMIRVEGPFMVKTREGIVYCTDGYLAIDADGFPYPVSVDVHDKTYELVVEVQD